MATDRLRIEYDEEYDIVKIEGVRYTGCFFREFSLTPSETLFKIINRDSDGVVTITTTRDPELLQRFNNLTGSI